MSTSHEKSSAAIAPNVTALVVLTPDDLDLIAYALDRLIAEGGTDSDETTMRLLTLINESAVKTAL